MNFLAAAAGTVRGFFFPRRWSIMKFACTAPLKKWTASEVNVRNPAMAMKNNIGRGFFLAAALLAFFARAGAEGWLNEDQVRQAMRAEAYRLLAQKIDSLHNGSAGGFDYHIEQAYEKIKNRLPDGPLSASELEVWLHGFQPDPGQRPAGGNENEFQLLIDQFILGMSLEIINTLQYECEQVEDLIARVAKIAAELKKAPHPDREALGAALENSDLTRKTQAIVKNIDRRWRVPDAGADDFAAYSVWKKNMTGINADRDLRLVFELGGRYRPRYPFLDQFMGEYRRLAEAFRQAVIDLNAVLVDNGAADEAID
ncbi:MAG: hypothetical protein NTW95_09165 [Candidatus Aminicenantes bacterium]|nr:hypothetical protein [Candidatus Aminicenantes bacterium]